MKILQLEMYIPWSLCILSIILSVGLTWYYRTKDMNFFPTEGVAGDISSIQKEVAEDRANRVGPPRPPALNNELLLGSKIMPELDEFSKIKGSEETLLRLFSIKSANNDIENAYLAGERIMESGGFSDQQKREIAKKMEVLLSKIQTWVIDKNETYPLTLEIGNYQGGADDQANLAKILGSAFKESSGGLVSLKIKFSKEPSSLTIKYGDSFSIDTVLQIPPNTELIFSSLYSLLSNVVAVKFPDYALPQWNDANKAEFETGLTRLAWSALLSSFSENSVIEAQTDLK